MKQLLGQTWQGSSTWVPLYENICISCAVLKFITSRDASYDDFLDFRLSKGCKRWKHQVPVEKRWKIGKSNKIMKYFSDFSDVRQGKFSTLWSRVKKEDTCIDVLNTF